VAKSPTRDFANRITMGAMAEALDDLLRADHDRLDLLLARGIPMTTGKMLGRR